jgi:type IV pilus assembly protein PilE
MFEARSDAGFSLVELMVALAIAAIIGAVALPSYRDHMMRTRIPEATSGLLLTAMRLEQFYQDRRSYLDGNGCGADLPRSEFFEFSCQPAPDGQSFLLLATGVASGVMAGFTYTLDQQGNAQTSMLPAAWGDAPLACWINRRGASC